MYRASVGNLLGAVNYDIVINYSMDDATLIVRLFAHDRKALSGFYREYAPQLRRYIQGKVAKREDAEEILQDTLFAFLEGLRDFEKKSSLRTYLYSICQHKVIDFYRRKKLKHLVFSQIPQLETLVSPLIGPEAALDEVVIKEKIERVMASLTPLYRQVLVLKYLEQVPVEVIAKKLSISFKSAESKLFRARKNFVEVFLSI
jgi:RNA polymerase sigma-70 factor (ECF subfamily)